mgnify:CR=1 FL=1
MSAAMKPVAIFRHSPIEGPGYFAIFLEGHGIPWRLIAIDAGEAVPDSPETFSGLCFMGGPMSVNDDLPWIAQELGLIRSAAALGIPVMGHCLGSQLLAKVLSQVKYGGAVAACGLAGGADLVAVGTAALGNPDWMERVSRGLPLHAAPFTAAHLTEVGFTPSALDYLAGMGVLAPRDAA